MFKVTEKITLEKIKKFDSDRNIFYRFQNPAYEIYGEYTQSWGMIFSSAEEAMECAEEWGMTEEEAVLPGKSCMDTFEHIMSFSDQFSDNDVLLVFVGEDTYAEGHDGEYVAEYIESVAVYSMEDVLEMARKTICAEQAIA